MAAPAEPKRGRRNSEALMEQMPPDWAQNSSVLRVVHEALYPPNSNWYWYRRGRVNHTRLSIKYLKFLAHIAVLAMCASGVLMPLILFQAHAFLKGMHQLSAGKPLSNLTDFVSDIDPRQLAVMDPADFPVWVAIVYRPWFVALQCLMSGIVTMGVYYLAGTSLYNAYYVDRKDEAKEWKCQDQYLTPDRLAEERRLGMFNAFIAGVLGTFLYFTNIYHPWLSLYYETESRGIGHFFLSTGLCYLWIDAWSYWVHRILHWPFFYRHIHKWHHRYICPTPFAAFALHPLEFVFFQTAGIVCVAFWETHIVGYLACVLFIAGHNMIDHSGIDFEGDLPWMPSTRYHDDHHQYFHLNFGLHFIFWDWLGGTLRSKSRVYGEDLFVGQQQQQQQAVGEKKEN